MVRQIARLTGFFLGLVSVSGIAYVGSVLVKSSGYCAYGYTFDRVTVEVNDDSFSFSPSCQFPFNQTFTTSTGVNCQLNSGMCTTFMPSREIEVSCSDGGYDTTTVKCAKD